MKKNKKKGSSLLTLTWMVLLTATLCACGKKEPASIKEEDREMLQEPDAESLREKMEVPEKVDDSLLLPDGSEIPFTAEISVPDASYVGMYQLEAVELTSDYMEDVCQSFFDQGEYEIVWPSYIYSYEELEEKFNAAREIIETDDYGGLLYHDWLDYGNRLEHYTDEWEPYQVSDPGNRLVIYPGPPETESAYKYGSIDNAYVRADGMIGGKKTRITFMEDQENGTCHISLETDQSIDTYCQEYTESMIGPLPTAFVQTEEEAAQMAKEYMELLGLSDMELIDTIYLMVYDDDYSGEFGEVGDISTYRFTFGLCKNDVSMVYDKSGRGTVTIDIGPEGLEKLYAISPYRVVSSLTEETELLTFAQANEAAKAYMEKNSIYYSTYEDTIEFGYEVVKYEDGDILLPVWVYLTGSETYRVAYCMINAVDGTVIKPVIETQMESIFYQ